MIDDNAGGGTVAIIGQRCPWCEGTGERPGYTRPEACPQCKGRGIIRFDPPRSVLGESRTPRA